MMIIFVSTFELEFNLFCVVVFLQCFCDGPGKLEFFEWILTQLKAASFSAAAQQFVWNLVYFMTCKPVLLVFTDASVDILDI